MAAAVLSALRVQLTHDVDVLRSAFISWPLALAPASSSLTDIPHVPSSIIVSTSTLLHLGLPLPTASTTPSFTLNKRVSISSSPLSRFFPDSHPQSPPSTDFTQRTSSPASRTGPSRNMKSTLSPRTLLAYVHPFSRPSPVHTRS